MRNDFLHSRSFWKNFYIEILCQIKTVMIILFTDISQDVCPPFRYEIGLLYRRKFKIRKWCGERDEKLFWIKWFYFTSIFGSPRDDRKNLSRVRENLRTSLSALPSSLGRRFPLARDTLVKKNLCGCFLWRATDEKLTAPWSYNNA